MRFKCLGILGLIVSMPAAAFVHISELKPRLPVSPERPSITFFWNGDAPHLSDKDEIDDGIFEGSSDAELMAVLLERAMNTWNEVPTAYVILELATDPTVHLDENDEVFSIVVEEQESQAVAAAALPSFITTDPHPSDSEKNPHIIHDCDISVSTDSVSAKSLLQTLTHELGHCLGLGHPHSSYKSIMSYSTLGRTTSLSLDDKAGVSFLYPEPGESERVRYLTQCGVVGGQGGETWAGLWLGLPLIVVALRRYLTSL